MSLTVLVSVVAIQVLLFQFGSIAFTRNLFAMHFGSAAEPPADDVRRYLKQSARILSLLGIGFATILVGVAVGLVDDPTTRRLVVAGVSLISSMTFGLTFLRNRRTLRALKESLPDTGVRRAALDTREELRTPRFEMITLAAFLVTCTFVLWAVRHVPAPHDPAAGPGPAATRMVVYLLIQGVVTGVLLWFSARLNDARTTASPRFPMFRDHPDVALRIGIELADAEVRAFNWAKLGIAAWFACVQLHLFFSAIAHSWTDAAHIAQWSCVGFLLLVFGVYLLRVGRAVRTGSAAVEHAPR